MRTTSNWWLSFVCFGPLVANFFVGLAIDDKQTNAANELFIAIPKNSFVDETVFLLVTTHDSGYVHFSVASSSFVYVGGVSNGSLNIIELPENLEVQDESDRNKGIRIRSTNRNKKISAYVLKEGQYLSGGYLALPSSTVPGVDQYVYYVASYLWDNRVNLDPYSGVVIVGSYNNTQITITPSANITIPTDLQSANDPKSFLLQGESYNVALNELETFNFDSILDLTGTKVTANKPISVLGYHECADVPMGRGFCDYIVEQFPPTINWGRFFHLSSLNSRTASVKYKIIGMSSSISTSMLCTIHGQTLPEVTTQSFFISEPGQAYEIAVSESRFCSLQANKPILVVQYSPGYSIDRVGDPFMLNIPPVEQYSNNYTLRAHPSFSNHMTITVGVSYFNPERIFVDQETIASNEWTPIYCSSSVVCGYGTKFSVSVGTHYVYHSNPLAEINVLVYGFEYHTAYGYLAGMQLNWIANVCQHGDVQLVPLPGSVGMTGKVEICLDGVWNNICGRGWSSDSAGVVCRQLGYSSQGVTAYSGLTHNRVAWPYTVSVMNCNGSETKLINCEYNSHFAECGQAEAAFAHCQPVSDVSVTTAVISIIHKRSPAIISCTAVLKSTISDGAVINITWRKHDNQVYNSNEISIVSMNLTEYMYQSNLTIHVVDVSNNGLYTCCATVVHLYSSNLPASSATSSVYLDVGGSSNLIFQLRLIGVGHCSEWLLQFSTPADKITQVIHTIVDNTLKGCEDCGLTVNHITDGVFHCFVQNAHEVTFRARLHSSPNLSSIELINYIIQWIESGASIAIRGVLLSVDQSCDVVIESFSELECHQVQQVTTHTPTTQDEISTSTIVPLEEATTTFIKTTMFPTDSLSRLFQLRLIGVGHCSDWLLRFSTVTERMMQVINAVVEHTNAICESCELTSNQIRDGAFQCFTQGAHEVTFRAHLDASTTSTPDQLIEYTVDWVKNGASIVVSGLLLTIDRTCDVVIESFSEPECTQERLHQTTELVPTNPVTTINISENIFVTTVQIPTSTQETTPFKHPSISYFNGDLIIVGVVALVFILIIAVLLTIIVVVCLYTKYSRKISSQSLQPSTMSPYQLQSYGSYSADHKTKEDEAKEQPPEYYSTTTSGFHNSVPSYYLEPTAML